MRKAALIALSALLATSAFGQQSLKFPRQSPKSKLMQTVGITDVTIEYSRPGVKGRKIWGSLVPYGEVWRTGANEATIIQFSDDVTVGGQKLAKGSYSLHTIPGADEWTLIFNSVADQWGSYSYDDKKDVARVKVKAEKGAFAEWLTFEVPQVTTDTATVVLRWENVAVPFTVNADTTNKVLTSARTRLAAADWQTPYSAAQFALDNKVSMDDGAKWLEQSLKAQETTANLYLKARYQAEQGKKAEAVKTAEAAIAKARPDQAAFVDVIKKAMEDWKK